MVLIFHDGGNMEKSMPGNEDCESRPQPPEPLRSAFL